jgi:hypothetical protein
MASGGGVVNPGTFSIKQKQHLYFTANEGPVRFQYKCLVSREETVISKTEL